MLFGTTFIQHQQGSLSDMGMPPTWKKGSHLHPGTTKHGKLRDSQDSVTAPTAKPDPGFFSLLGGCWSVEPTQGCQKCHRVCTVTLDGLVGSQTRLAIYPTLAICCWRVVICASLNTGFKGIQVVTYPANFKQLKSHWLKVPQKGLGTCIWINKVTHSILVMLCSMRGTKIAKVEGLWLVNRPECLVSEDPDDSPKVQLCSPFIVPSLNSMRDPCDVISWCFNHLLWSSSRKTLYMCIGNITIHLHICQHPCQNPEYNKCIKTSPSFP